MSALSKDSSREYPPAVETGVTDNYMLETFNLSRKFSDGLRSKGLSNIELKVRKGKVTAIVGESGSGKSTLLRLLYGLLQPDDGEVRFEGVKVPGPHEKLIPGHEAMRLISQHFDELNPYANVWDNVASRLSNVDIQAKEENTKAILSQLKIDHLAGQRVVELSGGEKQRVAIARAVITRPQLLLMDEPFNQLDTALREQLQQDILEIVKETDLTVILVSHDPAEIMGLADNLLILRDGQISASGNPMDLYLNPPNVYTARLLARSNVLTSQQAESMGIASKGQKVVIHPEWIQLKADQAGTFTVEKVICRGFYYEIGACFQGITLRIYQMEDKQVQQGQKMSLSIDRYLEVTD